MAPESAYLSETAYNFLRDREFSSRLLKKVESLQDDFDHMESILFMQINCDYPLGEITESARSLLAHGKDVKSALLLMRIGVKLNNYKRLEFSELIEDFMVSAEEAAGENIKHLFAIASSWENYFGDLFRAQKVFSENYKGHDAYYFFESQDGKHRYHIPWMTIPQFVRLEDDCVKEYAEFMRLKERQPETFNNVLNWD